MTAPRAWEQGRHPRPVLFLETLAATPNAHHFQDSKPRPSPSSTVSLALNLTPPPQPGPPITGVSVWALLGFYPEAVRGERRGLCTWGEGHRVRDAGWRP